MLYSVKDLYEIWYASHNCSLIVILKSFYFFTYCFDILVQIIRAVTLKYTLCKEFLLILNKVLKYEAGCLLGCCAV